MPKKTELIETLGYCQRCVRGSWMLILIFFKLLLFVLVQQEIGWVRGKIVWNISNLFEMK